MKKIRPVNSLLIWPTLPPQVYFKAKSNWRPFPLDQDNCRIYSKARQAIWQASTSLNLGPDAVILMPAYHHGSEVEALLKAGLKIRYYEVNELLEPDPAGLEALLDANVCALYLIHYLGFPQDALFWRQWCDARQLLLVEDAAQAFLATQQGQPVGSHGHMAFFCLYKTYGLPDGGAVVSSVPPPFPSAARQSGLWRAFKRHINWVATRRKEVGLVHLLFKPVQTWWNRSLSELKKQHHKEFEIGDPSTPPSTMTSFLLPKLLDEGTAECRRKNYRFLLGHLGEMVPPPFDSLPEGASPFAFPIEVSDARSFLLRLRHRGVGGLLFWLNPHPSLPVADFPRSKALREGLLALPVHQELTMADLEQIVQAVQEARVGLTAKAAVAG